MKNKTLLSIVLLLAVMFLPTVIFAADEDVAMIGSTGYATLADAVDAVPTDGTETIITLLTDVEDGVGFVTKAGQNVVIDFAGYTYSIIDEDKRVGSAGTETLGCQLKKGSTVTLKNGTFESSVAKILVQNYSDLTIKDMVLDTTGGLGLYTLSNNCGEVYVGGNTSILSDKVAFDVCWAGGTYAEGAQVTIETTGKIVGDIEIAKWNDSTSTEGIKNTLTIKNINHEGNIVPTEESFASQVTITGGTFDSDVDVYVEEGLGTSEDEDGNVYVGTLNDIKVSVSESGGSVSVSTSTAVKGQPIKITVSPSDGFILDTLKVFDKDNNEISVTDDLFTMVDSEVTIQAIFKVASAEGDSKAEGGNTENNEEKDITPTTGVESTVFIVFATIAIVSIVGMIITRKRK